MSRSDSIGHLINRLQGKRCGLTALPSERIDLEAEIAAIESQNPTPSPLTSPEILGDWRLIYTTSNGILGLDRVPLTELGEVYQCLRGDRLYNIAETNSAIGLKGIVAVGATYSGISQTRVQVKFRRSILGLQAVMGYRSMPQFIDRLEAGDRFLAVDFPIPSRDDVSLGWLEITYLDHQLRIGRGSEGSLFVLVRV